jgi:hypothetical protein
MLGTARKIVAVALSARLGPTRARRKPACAPVNASREPAAIAGAFEGSPRQVSRQWPP